MTTTSWEKLPERGMEGHRSEVCGLPGTPQNYQRTRLRPRARVAASARRALVAGRGGQLVPTGPSGEGARLGVEVHAALAGGVEGRRRQERRPRADESAGVARLP